MLRRARDWGVHIQVDGMHENVLKFKPPLAFTLRDADTLVSTVDRTLTEWEQVRIYACMCGGTGRILAVYVMSLHA